MRSLPPRRPIHIAVISAGILLAAGLGFAAAFSSPLLLLAVAAATILLIALSSESVRRLALPVTGMLAIALGASTAVVDASPLASVAIRLLGLALVFLSCRRVDDPQPVNTTWLVPVSLALGGYLVLALGLHGAWSDLVAYGIGLAAFAATIVRIGRHGDARTLRTSAMAALQIVLALSLVAGLAVPSIGIEQGRLRGIIENANLLGFFAFLVGGMAVLGLSNRLLRSSGIVLAATTIAWTASRGSALALAIVLVLVLVTRRPTVLILIALVGMIGTLAIIGFMPTVTDAVAGLLRDNDSRSDSIGAALDLWHSSPLVGVGDLPQNDFIASSPLRAVANAGVGGAVVVVTLWCAILRTSAGHGLAARALGTAAIAHSLLEGWLLSPIGSLLLLYFLVWSTYLTPTTSGRRTPDVDLEPEPHWPTSSGRRSEDDHVTVRS